MITLVFDNVRTPLIVIFLRRKIDVQGLIGNIGGYIGLWLGYCILQVPGYLRSLQKYVKNRVLGCKGNKISSEEKATSHHYEEEDANLNMSLKRINGRLRGLRILDGEIKGLKRGLCKIKASSKSESRADQLPTHIDIE